MRIVNYNIHDLVRIRVEGGAQRAIKDLNEKYHYFEGSFETGADIVVRQAPFEPDLENGYWVDRKYFVKKNLIYFEDQDKGLCWRCEIKGVDSGPVTVRFWASRRNRLRWPWVFFPDWVMHHYVLQPLIERKLMQSGVLMLHAAGLCREGKAILFVGRGQTFKTTIAMNYCRKGWEILGDDFVLLKNGEVMSFPVSPALFEFSRDFLKEENLYGFDYVRLFFHLFNAKKTRPWAACAKLKKAVILLSAADDFKMPLYQSEEKLRMIQANQNLEKMTYMSYGYHLGRFWDVYEMAYPGFSRGFEGARLVEKNFQGIPVEVMRVPVQYRKECFEDVFSAGDRLN